MNLSVPHIKIIHPKSQGLPDPHAGTQKHKNQGPVPDIVNGREKLFHIGWMHGPGQGFGELEGNVFFQEGCGDDFLVHQEMQKRNKAGQFRPHRGDF